MAYIAGHVPKASLASSESSTTATTPEPRAHVAVHPLDRELSKLHDDLWRCRRLQNAAIHDAAQPVEGLDTLAADIEERINALRREARLPSVSVAGGAPGRDTAQGHRQRWEEVIENIPPKRNDDDDDDVKPVPRRYTAGLAPEPHISRACSEPVMIILRNERFSATGYRIFSSRCYWLDGKGDIILEHQIAGSSRKCIPNTLHRKYKSPFSIDFLENQGLSVRYPPHTQREQFILCRPQYQFTNQAMCEQFQSDLRGKDLLIELHLSSIATKTEKRNQVVIKIWQSQDDEHEVTLTFAIRLEMVMKDYELPARWFRPIWDTSANNTTIRLEFVNEPTAQAHRRRSYSSRFSLSQRGSSVSSIPGTVSSLGTTINQKDMATEKWIKIIGYLDLKFESSADAELFLYHGYSRLPRGSNHGEAVATQSPQPSKDSPLIANDVRSARPVVESPLMPTQGEQNTRRRTQSTDMMLPGAVLDSSSTLVSGAHRAVLDRPRHHTSISASPGLQPRSCESRLPPPSDARLDESLSTATTYDPSVDPRPWPLSPRSLTLQSAETPSSLLRKGTEPRVRHVS